MSRRTMNTFEEKDRDRNALQKNSLDMIAIPKPLASHRSNRLKWASFVRHYSEAAGMHWLVAGKLSNPWLFWAYTSLSSWRDKRPFNPVQAVATAPSNGMHGKWFEVRNVQVFNPWLISPRTNLYSFRLLGRDIVNVHLFFQNKWTLFTSLQIVISKKNQLKIHQNASCRFIGWLPMCGFFLSIDMWKLKNHPNQSRINAGT